MTSHVYILRHAKHPRFKIGKANDILSRARNFRWETIDFSNSLGLLLASETDAYVLEKILQRTFHQANVDADEVIASGGSPDGASEWFDISCWPRLTRYLEDNRDLHPHEMVSGESLALLVKKLLQPTEAALVRAQLKKEKEARRAEREVARIAFRRQQMANVEQILLSVRPKLIRELERHLHDGNIVGVCHGKFGASLLLASTERLKDRALWELELLDTHYSYQTGGGSLISSFMQMTFQEGTICAISLPRLDLQENTAFFEVDQVIHHVFVDELAWLQQLPSIPESWLDTIFNNNFMYGDDENRDEADLAASRLLEAHQQAGSHRFPPLSRDQA